GSSGIINVSPAIATRIAAGGDMKTTPVAPSPRAAPTHDPMPLLGIDHLELYVGNAAQAAYYFKHAFGFREVAYAGLEGGVRDPWHAEDEHGRVRMSTIATYGETLHTFVERGDYAGPFLPGYGPALSDDAGDAGRFAEIDHVVGNVELGRMEEWVAYYERVLGFTEMIHFSDEDISTEYSALMSKVVTDGEGRIKFPINEPAEGRRKSQIEEYLEYYGGAGVQHVAFTAADIVGAVR